MIWGWINRSAQIDYTDAPTYDVMTQPINDVAFIPLRLTVPQRKLQRLMRGIMLASSYTDKVDTSSPKRNQNIVKEVVNIMQGFLTGVDLNYALELASKKEFITFKDIIIDVIEYYRRFKMMNPDLLRTDYVKFLYMLQDAMSPQCREVLGFEIVSPVLSVATYCKQHNIEELLNEEDLPLAITPVPNFSEKTQLNKALRKKDVVVDELVAKVADNARCEKETVEIAIRSLNDANNFANSNADSAAQLIKLLKKYFKPQSYVDQTYLGIHEGFEGSRLSHEHSLQYNFVLQSLSLWKNICKRMFSLWMTAESDLLDPENNYTLRETGQGLQRVQKAPRLLVAVKEILEETKKELGMWVGLETIHLGDDQVPNAFHFIDKYGQITRIIVPILRTIDHVDEAAKDHHIMNYLVEVYGSPDMAKICVLQDFFRHGFDGSGGDTLEDAGSCIDGRLTSAWNWCNTIRQKKFYPLFLLAGFNSFDGDLTL